jgi:hypothetical protein
LPLRDPLLYFVSYGAMLVLFCSAVAACIWLLNKLRLLAIRLLGGVPREEDATATRRDTPGTP